MSAFFNLLPEGGNVSLEKCGDVVVSPKDNIVALFCHFCSDIFTSLPEFARHLQCRHSDVLTFAKEQNVYSVEELLSQQDEEQDDPSQSHNSSSGDSGLPNEADNNEDNKDRQETTELNAYQLRPNILEALAANDVDVNVPPDSFDDNCSPLVKGDLLAEVEAMLFKDIDEIDGNQPALSSMEKESETKIVPESSYFQVETASTKGLAGKYGRSKTEEKSLSICDLKSYSITRTSRKRQMKQMSSLKMRIIRSLEIEEMTAQSMRCIPEGNLITEGEDLNQKRPPKESNVLPKHLSVSKETKTIKAAKENHESSDLKSNLLKPKIVSHTLSNSNKVKTLMPSTNAIAKSPDSFKILSVQNIPSTTKLKSILKSNDKPEKNQQPFSTLQNDLVKPSIPSTNIARSAESFKMLSVQSIPSFKTYLKSKLESNAIPQQEMDQQQFTTFKDDLSLLQLVGLPIIKISTYEDKLHVDNFEKMRQTAKNFVNIFHSYDKIWNRRKCGPQTQNVIHELRLLTEELNRKLGLHLKLEEVKRLLNLINVWHAEQIDSIYFKKNKLSSNVDFYYQLFGFLYKMTRFPFFCEYCDQIFNLEADYKKHIRLHRTVVKPYEPKKMKFV